jgi:hypothetical protein
MSNWKLNARPHPDVLSGEMRQSDFAADLSKVAAGSGPIEYRDAEKFFARTYLTHGLSTLLRGVARRLAGLGGDPVLELQTNFGGGKTHTLLAVYHLASHKVPTERLTGVPALLDEAGIRELPAARVAVFDGSNATAAQPLEVDGLVIRTLWGRIAHGLLGAEGYALVAECDRTGTAPGSEIIDELLRRAGPCVILLDELVAFCRQLGGVETLPAGSWDANLTFFQALMQSVAAAPRAVLVATIPMSENEAGGPFGVKVLAQLHTYFRRIARPIDAASADEGCEIVRRRLFESVDVGAARNACRAFADMYRNDPSFPAYTREARYEERLLACYPFHPEIFDLLYGEWSTLQDFQKTRGVLQLLALVIRTLWNDDVAEPLVLPSSLPLEDPAVAALVRERLNTPAWGPILDSEVDGPNATPVRLDAGEPIFGRIHAARSVARTVFFSTAPGMVGNLRGVTLDRILLGCAVPGIPTGTLSDALRKLRDRLHYLFAIDERFWFDTRPNIRREMESRKDRFAASQVLALVRKTLSTRFGHSAFVAGFHPFTAPSDVPDDAPDGVRVVALSPEAAWSTASSKNAFAAASEVLLRSGSGARSRRNRLVFLAPDLQATGRTDSFARTALAWEQISEEINAGRLVVLTAEKAQVERDCQAALNALSLTVAECWHVALVPREIRPSGTAFDVRTLSSQSSTIAEALQTVLRQNEDVVEAWSPVFLANHLEKYYFKGGAENGGADEVSILRVWDDLCNICEPPFRRLLSRTVFEDTVRNGVSQADARFGYAQEKAADGYRGLSFRAFPSAVYFDERALLVRLEAAQASQPPPPPPPSTGNSGSGGGNNGSGSGGGTQPPPPPPPKPGSSEYCHYYAKADLPPTTAVSRLAKIQDELINLFASRPGIEVTVKLDIEAASDTPFPADLVRAVKENASPANLDLPTSEFS